MLRAVAEQRTETRHERDPIVVGGRRVATARRRVRHEVDEQMASAEAEIAQEGSGELDLSEEEQVAEHKDEHIGKKKLAKLQAKEERRKQREAELLEREERKKREQEREERMQKEREKQEEEEEAERERKRLEREEREKREEEEYQKLREAFVVDEEGFDQVDEDESRNLLREFEDYIRRTKVVNMAEMASHFNLRTEEAIDRLNFLIQNGTLTGVMDDRGKFIYITPEELQAVAKFINQRGRVSKAELVEYSNKLIGLDSRPIDQSTKVTAAS
ncbi:unnamed protein product [Gongylonema pulchrum]|uniref:DDRGK domain-containing protein 1 n=1 Tax=Gongylonema pulchrum TaxID=637853 RepID=A0A183E1V8_9BILA|nr:unnamed protein product [Gongylonema pulchrum]